MQQEGGGAAAAGEYGAVVPEHLRSRSDPLEMDGDSYSDPIDLIANPAQDHNNMSRSHPAYNNPMAHRAGEYYHAKQGSGASRDSLLFSDENYSNPIDMVKSHHQAGSRRSEHSNSLRRDDEVYISPSESGSYNGPATRPSKLELRGPLNRPAQPM